MKHKIKVDIKTERRGFFGQKKIVTETRIIKVDGKTYRELKRKWNGRPYTVEEMMLYDEIFDEP